MNARRTACMIATMLALALAAPVLAGFAGTDLFLPMAGRQAGAHPSNWYTTVWIHNPGSEAATARVFFLQRGTANPTPPWVDVPIAPGDTQMLENVVETFFHLETFGALRVTCDTQRLVVTSRVFSQAVGEGARDSVGQDFAGVPASFSIGLGEKSRVLGVHQTLPAADSEFRFNFGFVETTGHPATVRVRALDENGGDQGFSDIQVREYSQRQVAFKDHFPTASGESFRLDLEVISGSGKVIAYGSGIANGSQDPTTFEMAYQDELLGIVTVQHDDTLAGDGTAAAPLGIADGGVGADQLPARVVTAEKLADAAVTAAKLATSAPPAAAAPGVGATRADPLEALFKTGETMFWDDAFVGDITAVATPPGSGLVGGVDAGDASLAIAPGGVANSMLADNAVTAGKIADGAVADADVAFNFAASASKGGAATDLACTGCVADTDLAGAAVTKEKLAATGGTTGQVLATTGSALQWQTPPEAFSLPYSDGISSTGIAMSISNGGTGTAIKGWSQGGAGVDAYSIGGLGLMAATESSDAEALYATQVTWLNMAWLATPYEGALGVGARSGSVGVYGQGPADGVGVKGTAGNRYAGPVLVAPVAVLGESANATGVAGRSQTGIGVAGTSTSATGVAGSAGNSPGAVGVSGAAGTSYGGALPPHPMGVLGTSGNGVGVTGASSSNTGVFGRSTSGAGVSGESSSSYGVYGISTSSDGVYGTSTGRSGIHGESSAVSYAGVFGHHSGNRAGVEGQCDTGWGVYGRTSTGNGVRGFAGQSTGFAGYFTGKVEITTDLAVDDDLTVADDFSVGGTKAFRIDHPLDPENRELWHAAIESSEVLNAYSGNVVLDGNGEAEVQLPEWFEAVNSDARYQLTCIGGFAPVYVASKVTGDRFTIAGGRPGLEVSWQITAVRTDPQMRLRPFAAEREKPEAERGTYLQPAAHGQPRERGLLWSREQQRRSASGVATEADELPEEPADDREN